MKLFYMSAFLILFMKVSGELCPDAPSIAHGRILRSINHKAVHSKVEYECQAGYELNRKTQPLECIHNGTDFIWFGDVPECIEKPKCKDPGRFLNGLRSGDCCHAGSALVYECADDLVLIGSKTITCLKGATWSGLQPVCQPEIFCPEPPHIPHAKLQPRRTYDNFYIPYDEVTVKCDVGYNVGVHTDELYCDEDGQWDTEFPNCTVTKCEMPEPPLNGHIREIQESRQNTVPFGFEVNFGCDEGYRLIGNSWSVCDELGWSRAFPRCEEITCLDPNTPENGWRNGNDFRVGNVTEFGCFAGFQLLGSVTRECLPNGKWSGDLAVCNHDGNDCPNPGIPIGGVKIGNLYRFGDTVKFYCNPGKILIGSENRTCEENGAWSGEETKCLDENEFDNKDGVSFRLQTALETEKREQEKKWNDFAGNRLQFTDFNWTLDGNDSAELLNLDRAIDLNFPGRLVFYFVFDASGSVGELNFQKSIEFAKAMVKMVGVTEDGVRVGAMTFSNTVKKVFNPLVHTSTEEVLQALDNIEYTKGGTATTLALKELKEQMIPLAEGNLPGPHKSIVFMLTDGKANMEGSPKESAEELKSDGVEIYCIAITGSRNMKTLYDIATTVDEHVFILDSYETMDYLVQDIINGTIDYSKCGIRGTVVPDPPKDIEKDEAGEERLVGGMQVIRPWPWMAGFYTKRSREPASKARHICGGSLLNKFWILTAAHCLFKKGTGQLLKVGEIIMYLGLTDVKDHTHVQDYQVETILIHPEYDYKKSRFNYDIALLKLSRPAEFNAFVRPICLPPAYKDLPEKTQLYREGETAVAIGWGYEKELAPNEIRPLLSAKHLKELNMPIKKDITCRASLRKLHRKFTNVMFCAGSGKGGEDTCSGDSGGPLMQKQKNDIQQDYWTQVGIVSWGIGCALKGQYGYYTHVAKFVDWIKENIN